jgi:hypothetical protein
MTNHTTPTPPACLCGCGRPTKKASRYSPTWDVEPGEHFLYIQGHNRVEYIEDPVSGCWNWNKSASVHRNGARYGVACVGGHHSQGAHRLYYERAFGPIPEGRQIDHLCGNTLCVFPLHLEAVDPRVNIRRSRVTKLRASDVDSIRSMYRDGELPHDIAVSYGVSTSRIRQLTTGQDRHTAFFEPDGPVDPTRQPPAQVGTPITAYVPC